MLTAKFVRRALIGFAMLVPKSAYSADVAVELGDDARLFKVAYNTATAVTANLVAWRGETWTWLDVTVARATDASHRSRSTLTGAAGGYKAKLDGHVEVISPEKVTWTLKLSENAGGATDVFAAIAFKISPDAFARTPAPVPELRPDGTGWSIRMDPDSAPLVVSFDAPVKDLYFEPGQTGEIRALVMARNSQLDTVDIRMTVTVPGAVAPVNSARLVPRDATWWANDLHWNRAPVDLSFLNSPEKPAGKRGFLRARGEDLVFEDGTKARFWGTNLTAYALFQVSNPETVRSQAKRLSKLGFNLVRLHHHDSDWVNPNVFGLQPETTRRLKPESTRRLEPWALDMIGWWIKCLSDEGIYTWLDLHVGRKLTAEDGVEAFQEIAQGSPPKADMKGYLFVNDSIQARMKEFADAYLSHVNPHTGVAFKDDPAVAAVLVTNENDLTFHFGNSLLPAKNVPWHTERYMGLARQFASAHSLDFEKVWRSWEFGPSKVFLADLEHAYFKPFSDGLRKLGVKAPIIGTNFWAGMSIASLTSLAEGDIVDAHVYGHGQELVKNPRFSATVASQIAGGATVGKPYSVSEWNVEPSLAKDRHQMPLYIAGVARLQSWNALMQYAYSNSPMLTRPSHGDWESYTDPGFLALMPAAALLYRQGHVREARESYELALPEGVFTGQAINASTSRAIRTLSEVSKLRIRVPNIAGLDWVTQQPQQTGVKSLQDPNFDAVGEGATRVCSDTGELCRSWADGVFTVDTERSQVASGWLGGREVKLSYVVVKLATPNATVAVQSLDSQPIPSAKNIMISMSAQAEVEVHGRLPYLSEPLAGEIRVKAPPGLKAYWIDRDGGLHAMPHETDGDDYVLRLDAGLKTNWLVLK